MNEDWDEVAPGMFVMNKQGTQKLAEYMKEHGERIRNELTMEFDRLWKETCEEWDKLTFEVNKTGDITEDVVWNGEKKSWIAKPAYPKAVIIKESNPTNKPWWKFW